MNFDLENGNVLLVDKPYRWTSFDVVKKIRNTFKIKKIGHAGTLDPLATGLLILCTGKLTKKIDEYQAQEKEYQGKMILGKTTPSFDLETGVDQEFDISHLTKEMILNTIPQFLGCQSQIPPSHSAIRINGVRCYKKARKGEEVIINPREVVIKEFVIESIELPEVSFRLVCSKGTYVRSLVRDFGEALGIGAYMSALKRTRIGAFSIDDAYNLDDLINLKKNESLQEP
jgi:tRNA pseudouridine55 synthase